MKRTTSRREFGCGRSGLRDYALETISIITAEDAEYAESRYKTKTGRTETEEKRRFRRNFQFGVFDVFGGSLLR
jgi:hypothetical protein